MSAWAPHWQRLRLLAPLRWRLLAGLVCMLATVGIQLAWPQGLSYFIDRLNKGGDTTWMQNLAWVMLGLLILQAVTASLRYYLFESAGHLLVAHLRRLLFGALLRKEIGFYDATRVGELGNRLSQDVENLQETLTMGLALSLRSACVFVGAMGMLLTISPQLSLVLLVFLPLTAWLGRFAGRYLRRHAAALQDAQAAAGAMAHEHFSLIRLVHALNRQESALARYGAALQRTLTQALAMARTLAMMRGVSSLALYLALLLTLWLGAGQIMRGELSIGALSAYIMYCNMVTESASSVSGFWSEWMRMLGATDHIFSQLREDPPADAKPVPLAGATLHGDLKFNNVSFAYPSRPQAAALQGFSLQVNAGEKVALVGASGAGKSTVANLLLGFYPLQHGELTFDGKSATTWGRSALRAQSALVEQEPALFSGTIFENIAYAACHAEVSQAEVEQAARLAHAHDFISALPDGYESLAGERGVQLSGGQKQRIAIARALLRNPRLLILDEATSALDATSEALVQEALQTLMQGRTTIIIAHRLSTIMHADRIVVMQQGQIVQQGRHAELAADSDGLYARLLQHQFGQAA